MDPIILGAIIALSSSLLTTGINNYNHAKRDKANHEFQLERELIESKRSSKKKKKDKIEASFRSWINITNNLQGRSTTITEYIQLRSSYAELALSLPVHIENLAFKLILLFKLPERKTEEEQILYSQIVSEMKLHLKKLESEIQSN